MDIKKLNEAIAKALNEDTFYDTFDALKIEIANDLDNGSLGNNDFELEAHIEGIDIKDLRKCFREIVLSGIAECVREGTNCMDAMEVLISKDSIKAEDFDGILEDLYNLFNKSDDEIEEIRNGKEINLYCNWSIELPLDESLNHKKSMKESHSFTQDELANNRFVKLYQKCYEYRKEHPEMEAYEIANKLCFNANENWVNMDEIAKTWADMFVYDGAKDEDLIQKIREDIVEMIEEYLLDDEQDGDFE